MKLRCTLALFALALGPLVRAQEFPGLKVIMSADDYARAGLGLTDRQLAALRSRFTEFALAD